MKIVYKILDIYSKLLVLHYLAKKKKREILLCENKKLYLNRNSTLIETKQKTQCLNQWPSCSEGNEGQFDANK